MSFWFDFKLVSFNFQIPEENIVGKDFDTDSFDVVKNIKIESFDGFKAENSKSDANKFLKSESSGSLKIESLNSADGEPESKPFVKQERLQMFVKLEQLQLSSSQLGSVRLVNVNKKNKYGKNYFETLRTNFI